MNKVILAAAISLSLVGCGTMQTKPTNQRQKIEVACLAVSTANKVLTEAINLNKVNPSHFPQIKTALAYTDPICHPVSGVYPTLSELGMLELQKQANILQAERDAVSKE